jgi:hypothetical protein
LHQVCKQADVDGSGTVSLAEAVPLWDEVLLAFTSYFATKLEALGAPPHLYKGDMCVVQLGGASVRNVVWCGVVRCGVV